MFFLINLELKSHFFLFSRASGPLEEAIIHPASPLDLLVLGSASMYNNNININHLSILQYPEMSVYCFDYKLVLWDP